MVADWLSEQELLAIWDSAAGCAVPDRATALLALSGTTGSPRDDLAAVRAMSVGARDESLIEMRARTFGDDVVGVATCLTCRVPIEVNFSLSQLSRMAPPSRPDQLTVAIGEFEVHLRRLEVADVDSLGCTDAQTARIELLSRCVVRATAAGGPVAVEDLPLEVVAAIDDALAAADPHADLRCALLCPDCGDSWDEVFDIATFLWAELDAWALSIMEDVHRLAEAYGWREYDVLALSSQRREAYLDLVG
jgi:hypothetical protein